MCLNLSRFWPENPTYLEYWYFSDNFRKVCKQACVMFIPFDIFSISLIIVFFSKSSGLGGGLFSFFKGLAGQKTLTLDDINPVLDKMKEHLIGNVFILLFVMKGSSESYTFWLNQTDPRLTPLIRASLCHHLCVVGCLWKVLLSTLKVYMYVWIYVCI